MFGWNLVDIVFDLSFSKKVSCTKTFVFILTYWCLGNHFVIVMK